MRKVAGKMVEDYWESAKKLLQENDFLEQLRAFDKDNIGNTLEVSLESLVPAQSC
jgi:hypothetical protein